MLMKISILIFLLSLLVSCGNVEVVINPPTSIEQSYVNSEEPFTVINNNEPTFTKEELTRNSYEYYSELDAYGRCGFVEANIGIDLMPTEDRQSIGQVKPSGWRTVKYDHVEGKYLYNRCHLIGFQLTGENSNERNLITGTRYMNTEGMLPFENLVADYIKETKNHVLYRVTPVFEADNLIASGVKMEAKSVEDDGAGISFHVFVHNIQPGVEIDYKTGESVAVIDDSDAPISTYILNTNNKKFHNKACSSTSSMKDQNKDIYTGTRELIIQQGYTPCKNCNP